MLEERARELGRLIGQSGEYKAVKRAGESVEADAESRSALKRIAETRQAAQVMIERGERPTAEMEEQMDALLQKLQSSPVYQAAIVANENFDKVMVRVNEWILDGIQRGAASSIITLG